MTTSLLSSLTIGAVGLGSKAFLMTCKEVKVVGLKRLLEALETVENGTGRGVLTVSNHISVCDEPIVWGILPTSHYLFRKPMRWTLGASDICFATPLRSAFFTQGQVIETVRGGGIKQAAVDRSVELLDKGQWVHVFPEGKTTQPPHSNLERLKWGVGRMLMETGQIPTIIPMWLTGFNDVLDERRGWPRPIPRPGKRISITFGTAEDSAHIEENVKKLLEKDGRTNHERIEAFKNGVAGDGGRDDKLRSAITEIIREGMMRVGKRVSGTVKEVVEGKI